MLNFTKANTVKKESHISFDTPSIFATQNLIYSNVYGNYVCDEKYIVDREPFDSFLIMYTVDGSGTLVTDMGESTCIKNTIALVNCKRIHRYFANKHWKFYWFHFNGDGSENVVNYILSMGEQVIVADPTSLATRYFSTLVNRKSKLRICDEMEVSSQISEILAYMSMQIHENTKLSRNSVMVSSAIAYINENYSKYISIDQIAGNLNVSKSGFCHVFKKETGFSPYNFVINKRINQAKRLLKSTDKTVSEISYEVGFNSEANFIKTFKLRNTVTPSIFRKIPQ